MAASRYKVPWDNIPALAPNARVASTENNDYFADTAMVQRAVLAVEQYKAPVLPPFFNGCNNGDPIASPRRTRRMRAPTRMGILSQCAPAGAAVRWRPARRGRHGTRSSERRGSHQRGRRKSATSSGARPGTRTSARTRCTTRRRRGGGRGRVRVVAGHPVRGRRNLPAAAVDVTPNVPVTHAVAAGDATGGHVIEPGRSSVTDSQPISRNVGSTLTGALHLTLVADHGRRRRVADGGADHPTRPGASGARGMITEAVSGITAGAVTDIGRTAPASAAPSSAAPGTWRRHRNGRRRADHQHHGRHPVGGSGFTVIGTAHNGATQQLTAAQQVTTTATTPPTAGATITSTTWR